MNAEVKSLKTNIDELLSKNINLPLYELKKEIKADFWHYTDMQATLSIAENLELWFGKMSNCNDIIETELHKADADFIHIVSFCNSNTEQIPLWYLYSGLKGDGAALRLTPATMIKFLDSLETVKTSEGNTLHRGKDFDLFYGWVYYIKHSDNCEKFSVKYKGEWNGYDDWNTFIDNNYFVKDYPWEYEKEFRIVIKNKTKTSYDRIIAKLPSVKRGIDVKCAPGAENIESLQINVGGVHNKPVMTSKLKIKWKFNEN